MRRVRHAKEARLRGFSRRPRLGGGELALQDLVLGLQGLDIGLEDMQKRRIVRADGRGGGMTTFQHAGIRRSG